MPAPARRLAVLAAPLVTALLAACGPRAADVPADPGARAARRIAVLPFRTGGSLDPTGRFSAAPNASVPEDLGVYVAERLAADLTTLGAQTVSVDAVLAATPVAGAALYDTRLAVRVGRALEADTAVLGAVRRYVERVGSALSVESPASVEYQAMVVDVASGTVIGSYVFDFTQQPLAADITTLPDFLQGGGKWRTRKEILDRSLQKTAAKVNGTVWKRETSGLREPIR